MAGNKYIKNASGTLTEEAALQASAGAADAGKIIALDAAGLIDPSMIPAGSVPVIIASEALAAGDFINVFDNAGTPNVRRANATTAGKEAHGYVLAAVLLGGNAAVYFSGENSAVAGATGGVVYLSTTPGGFTSTAPSASGNVVQRLGVATSATSINVETAEPVVLA